MAEIPCDYFEAFLIPTTALASLDSDKVKVVNSQAELDAVLAAGEGSGQYIVRQYENHAEVLTAGHSKEDTAAFLHAQGVEEADMRYQSGVMGVPITFLDKYCPEQFEIVGSFNNSRIEEKEAESFVLSRDTISVINGFEKIWNGPVVNKKPLYKRIVIRRW
mgnify:FL=1